MCATNNKSRERMCASAGRACSPPFRVSKRTRAIGENRSGPRGDMQKGPDLDKNSPSWLQRGLHPQLGTMLKGFIVILCPLFCIIL